MVNEFACLSRAYEEVAQIETFPELWHVHHQFIMNFKNELYMLSYSSSALTALSVSRTIQHETQTAEWLDKLQMVYVQNNELKN